MNIITINQENIDADKFVSFLRLTDGLDKPLEDMVNHKIAVHAARKSGLSAEKSEMQAAADDFRRVAGLYRAQEMREFLDASGMTLDDFENFISEMVILGKMKEQVLTRAAVEEYFQLNLPSFEAVELSHMILDSEDKAREAMANSEDDPAHFSELAKQESIAVNTAVNGGFIGRVSRDTLAPEADAKVFNAAAGAIVGPIETDDGLWEIFFIHKKIDPELNDFTKDEVQNVLWGRWVSDRAKEMTIETE